MLRFLLKSIWPFFACTLFFLVVLAIMLLAKVFSILNKILVTVFNSRIKYGIILVLTAPNIFAPIAISLFKHICVFNGSLFIIISHAVLSCGITFTIRFNVRDAGLNLSYIIFKNLYGFQLFSIIIAILSQIMLVIGITNGFKNNIYFAQFTNHRVTLYMTVTNLILIILDLTTDEETFQLFTIISNFILYFNLIQNVIIAIIESFPNKEKYSIRQGSTASVHLIDGSSYNWDFNHDIRYDQCIVYPFANADIPFFNDTINIRGVDDFITFMVVNVSNTDGFQPTPRTQNITFGVLFFCSMLLALILPFTIKNHDSLSMQVNFVFLPIDALEKAKNLTFISNTDEMFTKIMKNVGLEEWKESSVYATFIYKENFKVS